MGFMQVVKKSVSAGWNFTGWVGLGQIKQNASMVKNLSKEVFTIPKPAAAPKRETFEQCVRRLGLTEQDIQKRIKTCTQTLWMCLALGVLLLGYMVYIFMAGFYLSSFVCLMLSFMVFAYSFREHFHRFQMQQRRLGCTFQQWLRHTLNLNAKGKK